MKRIQISVLEPKALSDVTSSGVEMFFRIQQWSIPIDNQRVWGEINIKPIIFKATKNPLQLSNGFL